LVEVIEQQVRQLLYRSGRSVGETYRLLGDILDKGRDELDDNQKEVLRKCRTFLQSSMAVLESQRKR
jgi:CRISPR/Cas system CSM-associated protein Csm2 small subunit